MDWAFFNAGGNLKTSPVFKGESFLPAFIISFSGYFSHKGWRVGDVVGVFLRRNWSLPSGLSRIRQFYLPGVGSITPCAAAALFEAGKGS